MLIRRTSGTTRKRTPLMNTEMNRSTAMNLMYEELARAQMAARLGEAQALRRGRNVVVARRLSRRAEKAAQQARLAAARV
jgi:hypothetical protein